MLTVGTLSNCNSRLHSVTLPTVEVKQVKAIFKLNYKLNHIFFFKEKQHSTTFQLQQ